MHSRFRTKKEKKAGVCDVHGGGGGGGGGSPMTRSNSRTQDDCPAASSAGPLALSSSGVGAGLATRLGLALLRALALLRPAAAVLELLARALRLIASAVAIRGRSERQRELLQWLRRGSGSGGAEAVQDLSAVWRNGHLLCAAVNGAVPGACPAAEAGIAPRSSGGCDFLHAQSIASKYLGVAPAFSEIEVRRVASGGEAPSVRRLERYLRAVRRAANRLQFAAHNPAVAWTLPPPSPSLQPPPPTAAAAAEDSDADESSSRRRRVWEEVCGGRSHRARGTGLVAAVRGRRALFTVLVPRQQTSDLLIQVHGPCGDIGQKLIRATTFNSGSNENEGSASAGGSNRRATFSLKPWFSAGESRCETIPVETRVASGSVKVCYVPRSAGLHQVSLLSHGRHIAESPYNVMVDVRAGATEAPDFTEPWWTAAAGDGSTLPRSSARRVRIVYRVVDFVTEKMLLTNDGKLQKIPPNAPPPLLRALSLPDIRPQRPQSSEDDSTDSDSDTFYDSQSDACTSAPSPQEPVIALPPPKRDPEFFRKQYRKVLHVCRFVAQNKPSRRSLEILSTASRLLDGRPVRLPPELHSLLARIISESIDSAQRAERFNSINVGLNSISELMEQPEDDHTRRSRINQERKDTESDSASKALDESQSPFNAQDDAPLASSPSKVQTANERNSVDELHILRSNSAHNSQSEGIDQDDIHPVHHESLIENRENDFDESSDDVLNELESSPHEENNNNAEIDSCLLPQRSYTDEDHEPQSDDLISIERENPDSGINLSKTVTQSGLTQRPNVLQLTSTFAPQHLSDCDARVSLDGQKEDEQEKSKNDEALGGLHTSSTTNDEDCVSENLEAKETESKQSSVERSVEKDSLEEEDDEEGGEDEDEEVEEIDVYETIPITEHDRDELNNTESDPSQEILCLPQELPGDDVGTLQYTAMNESPGDHEVQIHKETYLLEHLSNKCPDNSPYEIQTEQFDDHLQFPGRPPEVDKESKADAWTRRPAPPSSPPPTPPTRRIDPRGEPPREPAPPPPTPREVPRRAPLDEGAALDRPPPNMDAVLSAASLEEALARFELHELQQAQDAARREAGHSPQGGAFGSSNGTSSCRSWDKGDSDYVSMDDIQSSQHHSPEGGMSGGEDLAEDWMRFLTVDYAPERFGPAEEEIWSGIERRAQDNNDHPVSDWVSNLMPSNRYHPRVLSPGIHPMTSIREEPEDRSSPASPTSPIPSPFKLLETQRSLQASPFLSVTSPSPEKGEEQFDSFEWRPQIMAPDEQVLVGSLIDLDNTAALKEDVDSSNQSLCEGDKKLETTSPQSDFLDFLLPCPTDASNDETLNEDKDISRECQEIPEVNALRCIDEAIRTGQQVMKPREGNNPKIGDVDIEAWNNAIDEYLAPSSLDSWESIRHPEHFSTPTCEDNVLPNETTEHNFPSTGREQDYNLRDNSQYRDSSAQDPSLTNKSTDFTSSIPSVSEELQETNDQPCEKSYCSREVLSFLTNNQASGAITVPQILIEDIDLILTPCVSPQLNSSFEELDNEAGKDMEGSRVTLSSQGERVRFSPIRIPPNTLQDDPITNISEFQGNAQVSTKVKPRAVTPEYSNSIERERQLNFDSPTDESAERNNFVAKSQRLESKFRDAAKENCSISQWPVESSADIVPLPIRVTQWKQFWDQKASAQKKKEEFQTSGVRRTIKRGSTHLEYLKCCHSNNASPQRKRQHPSIRIPGIVSKWKKSFESVVDANKVAREFMKLRSVKKRKSILPSYNVDQEQIIYVDDAKSNTISPEAKLPEKEYSVKPPSSTPLKIEKEKYEWPESNLVTSRKKKFQIEEPISPQRRSEYFRTIPPRNKEAKVAEYRKFWDNLSKGQSCGDLNREICSSGLLITEEIIIDEVPTSDVNKATVISESKTNETKTRKIPCDLDSMAEKKSLKEKSSFLSECKSIDASPSRKLIPTSSTSTFGVSRLNSETIKLFENVSQPLSQAVSAETPSCLPPPADGTESLCVQSSPVEAAEEHPPPAPSPPPPPRRLHIVNPEEIWYRARRIPIEEVEGLSSGSEEPSRSLDESDQSWSIVEEGAESQPDSLTDTCSLSSHRAAPPPPPPPAHTSSSTRATANRSNRQARSRFENAKLFFQNLESGGRGVGMASSGMARPRRGRLRGGTDLDTSTDDTGSEGGGVRMPRARRRSGAGALRPRDGVGGGGGGGAQSDTEALLLLSRERVRVPRGLFYDVRRGGVPQSRELLAALAAVDSRPASPYEEVAAAAGAEDTIGGVTLVPSPSPPASPAPRTPLPHAYDQEYPYLPATDPRHFRPRSTLKSFGLGGVHGPTAFQDL